MQQGSSWFRWVVTICLVGFCGWVFHTLSRLQGGTDAKETALARPIPVTIKPHKGTAPLREIPVSLSIKWKQVRGSYAPGKSIALIVPSDFRQLAGKKDWPIRFGNSKDVIEVRAADYGAKSSLRTDAEQTMKDMSRQADVPKLGPFELYRDLANDGSEGGVGGYLTPQSHKGVIIEVLVVSGARVLEQGTELTTICTWVAEHNKA